MKKVCKVFVVTSCILLLVFTGLSTFKYFSPSEPEQVVVVIHEKIGLSKINSLEEISSIIIPLSMQMITETYPVLQNRSPGQLHILESKDFETIVARELQSPDMSDEESRQLAVSTQEMEGVTFCPPPEIYLKYVGNTLSVSAYLHHSVHELLHGLSCDTTGQKNLPSSWDESLTDYFTSNIIKDYTKINIDSVTAFPYQLEIIRLLEKFIPEEELLNIYVSKDESLLKVRIDTRLGKGSYDALYQDLEIVYREITYNENGVNINPRVNDAISRIKNQLGNAQIAI